MNTTQFFSLPVENPILIFALLLLVILLSPIVLRRVGVPHIIGMIAAGIVLGPGCLNILARDSSITLYGTVGMLYIMFLSGVEADMRDFRQNRRAGIIFGLLTALIPLAIGVGTALHFLSMDFKTSLLLASIYASHTLIAYPIVSKYGILKSRSVNIAIMGTIITNVLSLLVFAVMQQLLLPSLTTGAMEWDMLLHWLKFAMKIAVFSAIVMVGYPRLARRFFKKYTDNVIQYVFVLALVLLAAFMSQIAEIEGIIGAFLAGIALNRYIPNTSGLMNRIDFVGNAIFIPFFLIGTGMQIDLRALATNHSIWGIAALMTAVAICSKYVAALLTRYAFGLKKHEGWLLFGLSNAQAAATLAVVTLCRNEGLLGDDIFYGSIVMVFVTCFVSSIVTERAARKSSESSGRTPIHRGSRMLIAVSNPSTIERLLELAKMLRNQRTRVPLYALHVTDKQSPQPSASSLHAAPMHHLLRLASATDTEIKEIEREDDTIATGIVNTSSENNITDIVMGMAGSNITSAMFAIDIPSVLRRTYQGVWLAKLMQPLNTLKRIVITLPPQTEYEAGFGTLLYRLSNLHRQTQAKLVVYANDATLEKVSMLNRKSSLHISMQCKSFSDWHNFIVLATQLKKDDLFVCTLARRDSISYIIDMDGIPSILTNYFRDNNILIVYPEQYQSNETSSSFT
jgi:Kef-type K+ transport system membrane component KefB